MNETMDKTAPSMVITEKRAHKPGGCVGIFFQLFDWNRRFAKKKLFSQKYLPSGGTKEASKRFGGTEKMPKSKSHLIADENRGGFPNLKKKSDSITSECVEPTHETRAPSLVARLMGLESMPAIRRDKSKKASFLLDKHAAMEDNSVKTCNVVCGEDSSLEKSRPQKIQKTGLSEKRILTRFGSEASQIKNVLSRARKLHHLNHHHPKLASPVRNPRLSASRRTSRLIDTAARILEPGLQATSRAKCALTYSSSLRQTCENKVMREGLGVISPNCGYNVTCCRDCGSLVDVLDSRKVDEDKPLVYACPFKSSLDQEEQNLIILPRDRGQSTFLSAQGKDDEQATNNQKGKSQKNENLSLGFNNKIDAQNQMLQSKKFSPESRLSNSRSMRASSHSNAVSGKDKDFVTLSSRTRQRIQRNIEKSELELERRDYNSYEDSISPLRVPMRKRRVESANGKAQSSDFVDPTTIRQNAKGDTRVGKDLKINCRSLSHNSINNRACGSKESNVVPLTLGSPTRDKNRICRVLKEREWAQSHLNCSNLKARENDSLDSRLHRKLKALASREETELIRGRNLPRKSTAMILQELSALAVEQPVISSEIRLFQFTDAKEAILKTELLFRDRTDDFLISSSLLDKLVILTRFTRGFLLDCVIEHLDFKYDRCFYYGSKAWRNRPLYKNMDMLVREIFEEVQRWTELSKMAHEEIINFEMNHCSGKWKDFDIEKLEIGEEIDYEILHVLVDELVVDLWACRLVNYRF